MKDVLSKKEIAKKLHITAPFLMIEKFIMLSENKAESVLFTNKNDWFFQCHLPKEQVMPATLIVEAMLQTLVLLIYETFPHAANRAFITQIQSHIMSSITPEKKVIFTAKILSSRRGITKGEVVGVIDGKTVCKGIYSYASPHLMHIPKLEQ